MSQSSEGNVGVETQVELRVRYSECDPMGVAHHSAYPIWMEIARTEALRTNGVAYRELEERGVFFVVARLSVRYHRPARYDDLLHIRVRTLPSAGVKVEHEYEICRGEEVLARAQTTLACINREGKLQPIPRGTLG
jgi:acyl-CoA thioester hydrolase